MSHVETYHPPNNFPCYKCLKCGVVVANRLNFQVHISKVHAGDQPVIVKSDSNKNVETAPDMTKDTNNADVTVRRSELGSGIKEETQNVDEKRVSCIDEQLETPGMKEWNKVVNGMADRLDKMWICKNCNYQHLRKGYVMNHIETKHPSERFPGYKCLKCSAKIKTRMNFLVHVTRCQRRKYVKLNESKSVGEVAKPQIVFKVFPNHPSNKSLLLKSAPEKDTIKCLVFKNVPEKENSKHLLIKSEPEKEMNESLLSKSVHEKEMNMIFFVKKCI